MQHEMQQEEWYIKVDGSMKGPYPTRESANTVMVNEGINGIVVPGTKDGKEILFG